MKFDMGRAWNDAVALLRGNLQVVLVVAGVFFFLPYLALILLMPDSMQAIAAPGASQSTDPGEAIAQMTQAYSEIWLALLVMVVLQGIGMLGLLAMLTDRNRPTVGEALMIGAKCFLPYLGTQILQSVIFLLVIMIPIAAAALAGMAAAVILGLLAAVVLAYLFTKFSLTSPVIVIEGVMNPITALTRSWSLTKGNSVRLFLFYLLMFIALIVISIVVGIVLGLVGVLAGPDGALLVSGLSNGIINMIAIAMFLAVLAAIHRQLSGTSAAAVSEAFE